VELEKLVSELVVLVLELGQVERVLEREVPVSELEMLV
jgi:hypothetical protein